MHRLRRLPLASSLSASCLPSPSPTSCLPPLLLAPSMGSPRHLTIIVEQPCRRARYHEGEGRNRGRARRGAARRRHRRCSTSCVELLRARSHWEGDGRGERSCHCSSRLTPLLRPTGTDLASRPCSSCRAPWLPQRKCSRICRRFPRRSCSRIRHRFLKGSKQCGLEGVNRPANKFKLFLQSNCQGSKLSRLFPEPPNGATSENNHESSEIY
jgi:hypothetical protein